MRVLVIWPASPHAVRADDDAELVALVQGFRRFNHQVAVCIVGSGSHPTPALDDLRAAGCQISFVPFDKSASAARPGVDTAANAPEVRDHLARLGADAEVVVVEGHGLGSLLSLFSAATFRVLDARSPAAIDRMSAMAQAEATTEFTNVLGFAPADLVLTASVAARLRMETISAAPFATVGFWPADRTSHLKPQADLAGPSTIGSFIRDGGVVAPMLDALGLVRFDCMDARFVIGAAGLALPKNLPVWADAIDTGLETLLDGIELYVTPDIGEGKASADAIRALARGIPLIATAKALDGLPVEHEAHALASVADLATAVREWFLSPAFRIDLHLATQALAQAWREETAAQGHILADLGALRAAARRPRAVIVTDLAFWHGRLGNHARLLSLLVSARAAFDLHLVIVRADAEPVPVDMSEWLGARGTVSVFQASKPVLRAVAGDDGAAQAIVAQDGTTLSDHVRQRVSDVGASVVLVEYVWLAEAVRGLPRGVLRVLDLHDVMSTRTQTFKRFDRAHHAPATAVDECGAFARFDLLLTIQREDDAYLQSPFPGRTLHVTHAVERPCVRFRQASPPRLVFLGGNSPMNLDGLDWFLRQVWPAVADRASEFHVAGGICSAVKPVPRGVVLHGELAEAELDGFLDANDIAINPVFYGGGLKIKTIDYLARGMPTVLTPEAIRGMPAEEPSPWLLAPSREAFVGALDVLFGSAEARRTLGRRAFSYARRYHSRRCQTGPLTVLAHVAATLEPPR